MCVFILYFFLCSQLAAAEVAGQKKLDSLLAKVAKEQSHSDVIALQSRLKAREVSAIRGRGVYCGRVPS